MEDEDGLYYDLPLLDKVKDLLDKEKILYELKLEEEKQVALFYRGKYEQALEVKSDGFLVNKEGRGEDEAEIESSFSPEVSLVESILNLNDFSNLKVLNLSHQSLSNQQCSQIIDKIIEYMPQLTSLDLSHNELTDDLSDEMVKFRSLPFLGSLNLESNYFLGRDCLKSKS